MKLLIVLLMLWLFSASVDAKDSGNVRSAAENSMRLEHFLGLVDQPEELSAASPSAEPTAHPSQEPSAEPTERPITSPTESPTAAPSRLPTCRPTRIPTFVPTPLPTPLPGDPTLAPTPVPTASPSARPTFVPTPAPSAQTSPIVSFTANLTMGGLTSPELNTNAQNAVLNVTASSMNIPLDTVQYVTGIASAESRRKLSEFSAIHLFVTTYSILAVTKVVIPLSATSYSNPAQLYQSLTTKLNEAVTSGAFTEQLVKVSASFNATVLATVAVSGVSSSEANVNAPASDDDESDDATVPHHGDSGDPVLNDGAISGIVIGGFFFLVLFGASVYFFLYKRHDVRKVAADAYTLQVHPTAAASSGDIGV